MKCVIMANGEYGEVKDYLEAVKEADFIFCADGGANYAYKAGIIPDAVIGDMDSINSEVKQSFMEKGVLFRKYPRRKDFTDTQLTLALAEEKGASEVVFLGTLGGRLDHALSNIYLGIEYVRKGMKIKHCTSDYVLYLTADELEISGKQGDIISILVLTDTAREVCTEGLEYPLNNADLEKGNPYAVSNILSASKALIKVGEGVLAVLHYTGQVG
ncbi:thiamine diphosphokinase [Thermosyntropha sp.]|uniref:thiamine diphosphokinase n=1 Tax=Thermosyntropha sp. TaxID=2740820 RepID=UPI0025D05713|nr:thiamine diphosphokinase [Thermosyntropha sp.]MBO8158144.1 thiamine diphosphokinase [Thermosyntropha sp.]